MIRSYDFFKTFNSGLELQGVQFVLLALFLLIILIVQMASMNTIYGCFQLCLALQLTYFIQFLRGVNKMVDVVVNRMFDTINRFSPREEETSLSTLSNLKRFSNDVKYRKALNREADKRAREAQLFDIKENAPIVQGIKKRPFMGLSCDNCTIISRESLVKKSTEAALRNILEYQPPANKTGFLQRTFSHLHQARSLEKFQYIQVADFVLKDDRLKTAIEKTAIQQFRDIDSNDDSIYQQLLQKNKTRAKKILYDMRSTLSDFLLRFTSYVLYKLLPCFLTSVVVHPGQVEMLKKASKSNLPMIFLPLHRSHLDYILMSFILLNNDVKSPLVAAGDNLRIPFFGSLLRGLGAFFIKRRIDPVMGRKDLVYKAVLHTYMNECLKAGHNIEFFLEGGRTRTGKPCMPKYGVLSVIVEAFMDSTIEDAILVPVSINYEKLVDGNFVREQLGQPKIMETFFNALKGIWNVLNSNYGMMRIDFNQPFSLRELVKTFNVNGKVQPKNGIKLLKSNPSTTSLYGTDVVSDEHKALVESISKHIIYDCAASTSIMSTNAVAYLLLSKFRDGATLEELIDALDELRTELDYNNKDVGFTGDSIDVINYAVDLLGPGLVRKERQNQTEIIKPITILPNVIELAYYSNTVVTHFALESIISVAITASDFSSYEVKASKLMQSILDLSEILQYEFILCKPCQNLEQVVQSCLDDLIIKKEILRPIGGDNENTTSRRMARELMDDEEEFNREMSYELNQSKKVVDYLNQQRSLVMPLIEAYAIAAFTLDKLIGVQLLESEFLKYALDEMKLLLASTKSKHRIHFAESISVDAIKNALKLFQKWGYIECHNENKLRLYYLKEEHDNKEAVEKIYLKFLHFRQNLIV